MEGETVTLQDAFLFDYSAGVDAARPVPRQAGRRPASGRGSPTGSPSWASSVSPRVFAPPERRAGRRAMTRTVLLRIGRRRRRRALLLVALVALPAAARRGAAVAGWTRRSRRPPSALAGAGAAAATAVVDGSCARRGRLRRRRGALERAGVGDALPDFVLLVGRLRSSPARWACWSAGRCSALLLAVARPAAAPGWSSACRPARRQARVRRPARRLAAADGQQPARRAQPAAGARRGRPARPRRRPSEEFARVVNETRVGRDLADALDEIADRMGSDDFVWIAQAIAINREVGGNLAEVLDAVGEHHPRAQRRSAARSRRSPRRASSRRSC